VKGGLVQVPRVRTTDARMVASKGKKAVGKKAAPAHQTALSLRRQPFKKRQAVQPSPAAKKPRKPRKPRTPADPDQANHDLLSAEFRDIGRLVAGRAVSATAPQELDLRHEKHTKFRAEYLTHHDAKVPKHQVDGENKEFADWFDDRYRKDLDGHDEALSTSSVRSLVLGVRDHIAEHGPLSPAKQKEILTLLDSVSRARLPTKQVGMMFGPDDPRNVQHPGPVSVLAARSGENHGTHDLERRRLAAAAARGAIDDDPNWTAETAIHGALAAAMSYTVNDMAASPTAGDVLPHMLVRHHPREVALDELEVSNDNRERFKAALGKLGPRQEVGDDPSIFRLTGSRFGLLPPSPKRTRNRMMLETGWDALPPPLSLPPGAMEWEESLRPSDTGWRGRLLDGAAAAAPPAAKWQRS